MQMENENRRGFFIAAIYGLWGLITATLAIPAGLYLLVPPKLRKSEDWTEAGDVAKLQPGSPVEMVFRKNRSDGWRVISEKSTAWVVKKSETEVIAYAPQCPHLGCAYHWDDGKNEFLCPCHTSTFALDGKVTAGPSARGLDRYEVKVENNKLMVGKVIPSRES